LARREERLLGGGGGEVGGGEGEVGGLCLDPMPDNDNAGSRRPNLSAVGDAQWLEWTEEILNLCTELVPWGKRPEHLREWVLAILMALKGGAREMLSVPIQHYKSTTTLVTVAWILKKFPALSIVIMQHSHDKAVSSGQILRDFCTQLGVKFQKGQNRISDWRTEEGGGCVVMSVEQSKIGYPIDLLLADDPVNEISSATKVDRDAADQQIEMYTMRAAMNLDSVLIVASPWTDDDPIIRRSRRTQVKWHYVSHSGIQNLGTVLECAFAPAVMSLDAHRKLRRELAERDPTERTWMSQIQCMPLPPALGFFPGEYELIGEIPKDAPYLYGIDCAFTQGKKTDNTAIVGGAPLGDNLAIDFAYRGQIGLKASADKLCQLRDARPEARFVTYASGPEIGVYHALFQERGLNIEIMHARWNKATRAQKTAHSWQHGRILVKFRQPWTGVYLNEMHSFDGSEVGVDDQADATVALHDACMLGQVLQMQQFAYGSPGAAG
jgi:phage terminase large subunit-like protein